MGHTSATAQKKQDQDLIPPSQQDFALLWMRLSRQLQQTWHESLADQGIKGLVEQIFSPDKAVQTFSDALQKWQADPLPLMAQHQELMAEHFSLWEQVMRRMQGEQVLPLVKPDPQDKRFKDEAWQDNLFFDYLKQSYLLSARSIRKSVHDLYGSDVSVQKRADFYTRQWLDACSPSNFCFTNPKVLQKILETGGKNLIQGLHRLCDDLEKSGGKFHFSTLSDDIFILGKNIATTPGHVIYQNKLFQLIQYQPTTPQVHHRPILMIPPWIKKYYVFDMRPHNSWVKWLVDQGFTVFMVSWVNPDTHYRHTHFADYVFQGALQALKVVSRNVEKAPVHVAGYCLGGTLLNCLLAYLKKKPEPDIKIASATYLTTLTDFSQVGDFSVFIDDDALKQLEHHMAQKGYMDGAVLASVFNMLRANDMIWSFIVNSYLLAQEPMPFDLLHWNADLMHLPEAMQKFLLRHMYQKNELIKPGGLSMGGVQLDLRDIDTPTFMLSTKDDHIAPWDATYSATQLYQGPVRFVLSGSGHVAGIINPPSQVKYGYWTNPNLPSDPEAWFADATPHEGSWWIEWLSWLQPQSGEHVEARIPGQSVDPIIEEAPGQYARMACT